MTRKHFWTDPYARTLDTRIATVDPRAAEGSGARLAVTLDATIFYAESGGQESDAGTIGGRRVLAADKRDRDIVYTLDDTTALSPRDPAALVPRTPVAIAIDWDRVPCGGTHLRRTGEIGTLALKRDNRGKGQQRIVITAS